MSTPAQIKSKLAMLDKPPIAQVITDVIREVLADTNMGEDTSVGELALERYAQRVIKRLQGQYKTQLRVEDVKVRQMDVLEAIEAERVKEQLKREGK